MKSILCIVQYEQHSMHCTLYSYSMHCTLWIIFLFALYPIHYILHSTECTAFYALFYPQHCSLRCTILCLHCIIFICCTLLHLFYVFILFRLVSNLETCYQLVVRRQPECVVRTRSTLTACWVALQLAHGRPGPIFRACEAII